MTHGEPITSIGTGLLRIAAAILGQEVFPPRQTSQVPNRHVVAAAQVSARLSLARGFRTPFFENIKGMTMTVFAAKKQRLSTSMFDWAKPVILTRKKSKRLGVEDWIA